MPPAPTMPPPRRRPRRLLILIVLVVVIVIVLAGVLYYVSVSNVVDITEIDVYSPDNACGLATHPIAYDGFNDTPGSSDGLSLPVPNYNSTGCAVYSVTTNTSGFGVSDTNVPVLVPGNGNGTLNLTLSLPGNPFTGIVNLVFT